MIFLVLFLSFTLLDAAKVLPRTELRQIAQESTDLSSLKNHFEQIAVVRVVDSAEHARVGDYIAETLKLLGLEVSVDEFSQETLVGRKFFRNIIADWNPRNANDLIVLSAHYDSKVFDDFPFIAATDSAMPCAMLLELAEYLTQSVTGDGTEKRQLQHVGTRFVFFDGEEAFLDWTDDDSLYGARHLASLWEQQRANGQQNNPEDAESHPSEDCEKPSTELSRIRYLVLLDLLGGPASVFYDLYTSTSPLYIILSDIEQQYHKLKLFSPRSQRFFSKSRRKLYHVASQLKDDHKPFADRGVPTLHVIPVPFGSEWHTEADNADIIDYQIVRELTTIFKAFLLHEVTEPRE
tara:strand:+ start:396 stop:1445 length:1050 start_codon:yes stop_codon:yes gene_type:complete